MDEEQKNKLAARVFVEWIRGKNDRKIKDELSSYVTNTTMVSRLRKYARKNLINFIETRDGEIQITISPNPRHVTRKPNLEAALRKEFSFRNAIVVDFDAGPGLQEDNSLHEVLGTAQAEHLLEFLRDDDHVGIEGGRGTFFTAQAIKQREEHPNQTGIKFTALCGYDSVALWVRESADGLFQKVDADDVAYEMATAFAGATAKRLRMPLVYKDHSDIEQYLANGPAKHLSRSSWKKDKDNNTNENRPSIALIGVGALAGGHRFYQYKDHPDDFELYHISKELSELLGLCHPPDESLGYCPVGDIGNYLYFVDPPDKLSQRKVKKHESKIKELIEKINSKLLTVPPEQLNDVDNIIVIAGGRFKREALYTALTKHLRVQALCTDKVTAEYLLGRATGLRVRHPIP